MTHDVFRYRFARRVPASEIEGSLVWAWLAAEGLFGEARVRLEATHLWDRKRGICVIRARGAAGRAANLIFVALIGRGFGPDAFQVERPAANRVQPPKTNVMSP